MKGYYVWFTFSFLFAILALGLVLLGVNTPYWTHYSVAARHSVFPYSFERYRGIYKECYTHPQHIPSNTAVFYDVLGDTCRFTATDQLFWKGTLSTGRQMYAAVSWGLYVSGGVALLLQAISIPLAGSVPCSRRPDRRILAAGLTMAVSSLLHSVALGLWYTQKHVASNYVNDQTPQSIPLAWRPATTITYGWSLFISCAGAACSIAATALCLVGYCLAKSDLERYYYSNRGGKLRKKKARGQVVYPGSFYTTSSSEFGYTSKHKRKALPLPLDEY